MAQRDTEEKFFEPLSERETWLADQIVNISFSIHKEIGPGLLESIYD